MIRSPDVTLSRCAMFCIRAHLFELGACSTHHHLLSIVYLLHSSQSQGAPQNVICYVFFVLCLHLIQSSGLSSTRLVRPLMISAPIPIIELVPKSTKSAAGAWCLSYQKRATVATFTTKKAPCEGCHWLPPRNRIAIRRCVGIAAFSDSASFFENIRYTKIRCFSR